MTEPDELAKLLRSIDQRLANIEQRIGGTGLGGKLRHLELEVQAVQRHLRLGAHDLDGYADPLVSRRFRGQSQNEEDGISLAIFEHAGIEHGRFVELGCGGNGGNSGFFAKELGWSGLMVDAQQELVNRSRQLSPARITAVTTWITKDGVDDLVREHGYDGDVDLLSIDVDGNDWWIWEALTVVRPRLVITEYNSNFGPDRAVTVPYSDTFDRHAIKDLQRIYYGASLAGFDVLARRRGYRLVAVEPRGVNAFWLRDDVAPELPRREPRDVFRLLEKHLRNKLKFPDIFAEIERRELPLVELGR